MRYRPVIWLAVGLLSLAVVWRSSEQALLHSRAKRKGVRADANLLVKVHSQPDETGAASQSASSAHRLRLSNTSQSLAELLENPKAVLLENALWDTGRPITPLIPIGLRSEGDPGAYIVQCGGPIDDRFRQVLARAGATLISYIPNNAYLVRASAAVVNSLSKQPDVQAALPYEPYYKLKSMILDLALESRITPDSNADAPRTEPLNEIQINIVLFADAREQTLAQIRSLDLPVLGETASPFGPVLNALCSTDNLAGLSRLPGVQEIELAHQRVPATDLSRVALGVVANATATSNYLGLTGQGVLVNVNDSGVDASQPDLRGRVLAVDSTAAIDVNGHGTHIAGVIAGSGLRSQSVTNVPGSPIPGSPLQFRGMAPAALILAQKFDPAEAWPGSEGPLFQSAASTNALISNNSWVYAEDNDYDIAAAVCDAAVRDSLPGVPASQSLVCVFAAGNSGAGLENGAGGTAGSIQSPATAKNVISVGALEHPRFVTNQTWTCTNGVCNTNTPWLGSTDSASQVAAFSSRGNVGAGIEGPYGRFKPDVVAPGVFVLSTRSGEWNQAAAYSPTNEMLFGAPDDNYFEVLGNLDASAGPLYRFESGTSVAAAEGSGTLALMEEFFRERLGVTNSPALMKALLINGARSVGTYDFAVHALTNFQGWGMVRLPNSIPQSTTNRGPGNCSMFFEDQSPERALAAGQSRTDVVWIEPEARSLPLRITLAWTDPAANPLAGIKLVNNLDVIVTNLDTGAVFFGNDFLLGSSYTLPWDPRSEPRRDNVNNVENVFISPPLSSHYSVTVIAKSVNVNAVSAQSGVVQDYALVISSGDGQVPHALSLSEYAASTASLSPSVTLLTNQFSANGLDYGGILPFQRIGAGAPLLSAGSIPLPGSAVAQINIGFTNQWRFYVITNEDAYTNAVFLTFASQLLAADEADLLGGNAAMIDPAEGDIDLYVSQDSNLTNLDAGALTAADKSLGRGGSESLVFSNAVPAIYYIGVKCESAGGAQYTLMAAFSDTPFAEVDGSGNTVLRGIPAPAIIPGNDRTSVLCVAPEPLFVRRVLVTNSITQMEMSDLSAVLTHGSTAAVLLNHPRGLPSGTLVFDDSGEGDIPGARRSSGPGSLQDFGGPQLAGQWQLALASTNLPGSDDGLSVSLEPESDTSGNLLSMVSPLACRRELMDVPVSTTNLSVSFTLVSGSGPVLIQLYPLGTSPNLGPGVVLDANTSSGFLAVDNTSVPPLRAGVYAVRVCNSGPDPAAVRTASSMALDSRPPPIVQFTSDAPVPIADDALTASTLFVTNAGQIAALNVGVRIDHPRVSDLVLRLVSPAGTRVLLQENRGGLSMEGLGTEIMVTNLLTVSTNGGGPEAVTNTLETGQRSGTVTIDYEFWDLPDRMTVYYENTLLLDTGLVSNGGHTNLSFGPGASTYVTIVMNEGGNPDNETGWWFSAISTHIAPVYVTYTENTNFTSVPIKFAVPPLTNINYSAPGSRPASGIFYFPEESLNKLVGKSAAGPWTLEIEDTRAGGTNGPCTLLSWQLGMFFRLAQPVPVALSPGAVFTNSLGQGQIQWFAVDTSSWISFATNTLLFASVPVNLLFNPAVPPTGTNSLDSMLLSNSRAGTAVLQTNSSPALVPGSRYYLAVQNTNLSPVTFALQTAFDRGLVQTLQSSISYSTNLAGFGMDYYRVVISTNAVRAQFEVNAPTADVTLYARRGLPLPETNRFDYVSANPGTNDELIVVYDFSAPVPLSAGEWFLGVENTTAQPAAYSVMATEFWAYGTNLVIIESGVTNDSFCLTWTSLSGVHYFVQGEAALAHIGWITVSAGLTATGDYTSYCVPLPCPFLFFRVCEGLVLSFPGSEIVAARTPDNQVLVRWTGAPGSWYAVEWTDSLAVPSWSAFTNTVYSASGEFEFLDNGSESGLQSQTRYYRVLQLPQGAGR
jgi:subtilisin-like proprotein convertase family protein